MIRFVSAIAVAVLLLGGVALCQYGLTRRVEMALTREVHTDEKSADVESGDRYSLVLLPTFDVREDPFALDTGSEDAVRLLVREGTRELVRWTEDVVRGRSIRVDDLVLTGGTAELFVEAVPAGRSAEEALALRLQILRGDVIYADRTLWAEPGGVAISQRVVLDLQARHGTVDRGLGGGAP